ncbi:MAG: ABC transporter permease [Bacteroidota bacterium]
MQFVKFIDDLSPVSYYSNNDESPFFRDIASYNCVRLFKAEMGDLVIKFPYLRRSYQSRKEVSSMLYERLPETAILAVAAMFIATVAGVFLGLVAAINKDSFIDKSCLLFSVFFVSIPSFFAAILFAWLFGYVLGSWTGLPMTGGWTEIDPFEGEFVAWRNLILPAIVLGLRPLAIIMQLTRGSMLEVLSMDYIRTARSKGLDSRSVLLVHALKNAMNPVVTAVSGWLGSLLAGAVFVEFIFGWNGIGKMTVTALENYDMPVVMGVVLFISFVFITINILADVLNGRLDPRIRLQA